ncbi:DUF6473 family protein [Jannaschia sp. LMIT008]|uniref:DUF6473 family protein n=1 Tax=Jannaschia maritima TaxID=3032585 RepID=UPI0028116695|nr:DUF6473 family protein [Jannaschia sp. LMIT008]
MSFERSPPGSDHAPCRYGDSKLAFRGPAVDPAAPHVVVIGSSEVHGRYVPDPLTDRLARALDRPVANLGVQNGGVDVFAKDEALLAHAAGADLAVVQVMGAQNLSNRLYTVHPRRNDRFLRHSKKMTKLFPEVDFSDFVFTGHMLCDLRDRDPARFERVVAELREAWTARMTTLLDGFACPKVLLWLDGDAAPGDLGRPPLFVTDAMVDDLRDDVDVVLRADMRTADAAGEFDDLDFDPSEVESARLTMAPSSHATLADRLAPVLKDLLSRADPAREVDPAPADRTPGTNEEGDATAA